MAEPLYIHPSALCESGNVGQGTHIWAFAHVMDGAQIGAECNIGDHAFVESGAIIEDRVTIKNGVMVWEGIHIEADAFIGPGVLFTNDKYPRSSRNRAVTSIAERYADKDIWLAKARVGQGASLGAGAVINPGVAVGEYAMIAAGTIVTKDVEPYRLVAGNPARPVGWVCRGGNRLEEMDAGALRCPNCHRTMTRGNTGPAGGGC